LRISRGIATITLQRPGEHNRIDAGDPAVILRHLATIAATGEIRSVVITGMPGKTFCSGYTLGQIATRLDRSFEDMLDAVERLPMPTICAMNGSAYGGGIDLAMACDLRIGVEGMRLFMPAARFGLHYYPGGLRRFVTRLGAPATKKIFLTARTLHAQELLRIGYLQELVPLDELACEVDRYTAALAACSALAVGSMKQHIDAIAAGSWQEEDGRAAYESSLKSSDTAQRLARLDAR
jgi:enoyl-CoA hydratase/carnithine racemase